MKRKQKKPYRLRAVLSALRQFERAVRDDAWRGSKMADESEELHRYYLTVKSLFKRMLTVAIV